MSDLDRRPIYGKATPRYGMVQCGLWMESPEQARLMRTILETTMRQYAGRIEETLLAKWHREVQVAIDQAAKENWIGWEEKA